MHHSITFLLLPTWYTNFLFIHTNYIKLNSSTCFERNPLIIRRSTTQIIHMQLLVSSLSASDRLVQPLSLVLSDDTRGCICTICVVDLLMMSGLRSKHVEEFNFMQFIWMNKKFVYQVGNNKKVILWCTANQISTIHVVVFDAIFYHLSTIPYLWTSVPHCKAIYLTCKVSENNWDDYLKTFNENIFLERCSTLVIKDLALL